MILLAVSKSKPLCYIKLAVGLGSGVADAAGCDIIDWYCLAFC